MDQTRDSYYREIIKEQIGENGLPLITNVALLFVVCLFILILGNMGFMILYSDKKVKISGPIII